MRPSRPRREAGRDDVLSVLSFDKSGTTRIGRLVLNHSFMIRGLVATFTAVCVGQLVSQLF